MKQNIEHVIEQYGDQLYRTALITLGNEHDAQDALQETFIRYVYRSPEFRDREHEKAWLFRVMVNCCKDILRFRFRHSYLELEALKIPKESTPDIGLLQEVLKLPEKQRLPVILHYIEGYSYQDIGKIMGISENAVKKRMQRAKHELSKRLEVNT